MQRRGGFQKSQMTRAGNRLAFTMWLNGATDSALAQAEADPTSLARSYGMAADDICSAIRLQKITRRMAS